MSVVTVQVSQGVLDALKEWEKLFINPCEISGQEWLDRESELATSVCLKLSTDLRIIE